MKDYKFIKIKERGSSTEIPIDSLSDYLYYLDNSLDEVRRTVKGENRNRDAVACALACTIENLKTIDENLEKIEQTGISYGDLYPIEKELRAERKRLLNLLLTELNDYISLLTFAGPDRKEVDYQDFQDAYDTLLFFSNDLKSGERFEFEKSKDKKRELDEKKDKIEEKSKELISSIDELEKSLYEASKAAAISKDDGSVTKGAKEEIIAIKRTFEPRVIKASKEAINRLKNTEIRQINISEIEQVLSGLDFYTHFNGASRRVIGKARLDFIKEKRRYLAGLSRTKKVFRKCAKKLRKLEKRLAQNKKLLEKNENDLKRGVFKVENGVNDSLDALNYYKHKIHEAERYKRDREELVSRNQYNADMRKKDNELEDLRRELSEERSKNYPNEEVIRIKKEKIKALEESKTSLAKFREIEERKPYDPPKLENHRGMDKRLKDVKVISKINRKTRNVSRRIR